jgi:hypothetical protein
MHPCMREQIGSFDKLDKETAAGYTGDQNRIRSMIISGPVIAAEPLLRHARAFARGRATIGDG